MPVTSKVNARVQFLYGSGDEERFPLHNLRRGLSDALQSHDVDTRGDVEYQLYADDTIRVVGSAQSSAGYFYVTAYLLEES